MDSCMRDLAYWLYIITIVVAAFGAALFTWWWIKKGKASAVYMYVTILLLGEAVSSTLSLWARHLWFTASNDVYVGFLRSNLWAFRHFVVLVGLLLLVCHMTYRAFGGTK